MLFYHTQHVLKKQSQKEQVHQINEIDNDEVFEKGNWKKCIILYQYVNVWKRELKEVYYTVPIFVIIYLVL